MIVDLFDYTMGTADLGKEVGARLREGKLTIPVIHALKQADSADRDQMVKIIQNEDFTVDEFKALVALMEKNEGIDYTIKAATAFVEKAKNALSVFEDSKTRDSLYDIADYALAGRL